MPDDIRFRALDWAISKCQSMPPETVFCYTRPGMLEFMRAVKQGDDLQSVVMRLISERKLVFVDSKPLKRVG